MEDFRLFFNRRRQWVGVYLHDVTPATFHRQGGGRWAYYVPAKERGRRGLFGELHLVRARVRVDVVAHELTHVLADRMRARRMRLNKRTEERIAEMMDELTRAFYREYKKSTTRRKKA